mmetsp:Transcript_74663/g.145993  ORF Transcript_74663/g.145993 Transcript_74663/m.145993 type:complete len:216 (-) Transcript_74663:88-735(-)
MRPRGRTAKPKPARPRRRRQRLRSKTRKKRTLQWRPWKQKWSAWKKTAAPRRSRPNAHQPSSRRRKQWGRRRTRPRRGRRPLKSKRAPRSTPSSLKGKRPLKVGPQRRKSPTRGERRRRREPSLAPRRHWGCLRCQYTRPKRSPRRRPRHWLHPESASPHAKSRLLNLRKTRPRTPLRVLLPQSRPRRGSDRSLQREGNLRARCRGSLFVLWLRT